MNGGIAMLTIKILENSVQAKEEVETLMAQGFTHDDIYIFTHSDRRAEHITEALGTETVGMKEQGFIDSLKNNFVSRGDELRSKMEAIGLTKAEAASGERELDQGKLILVAKKNE